MSRIDIVSGFLGAGKTTLIKKMLKEAYAGEQVVLIENEFGEIGIDGGFLKEAGIEIREMNSGCICCSLVGDFSEALKKVEEEFHPDRIIIEPSGVGKLSDVIKAVENVDSATLRLNSFVTVADAGKCRMYMKNFGEFFNNQIEFAGTILLSRTEKMSEEKLTEVVRLLKEHNPEAAIITTPWDQLDGKEILKVMEEHHSLEEELLKEAGVCPVCHHHHEHEGEEECGCHHHHEHEGEEECGCHHHHEHEGEEECGCHHHHEHEGEEECGCHHHHDHEDKEECSCHHHHEHEDEEECGCHHHHEYGHHHADEIFTSWGRETVRRFTKEELETMLRSLDQSEKYGTILRAKGIVEGKDGTWLYFDYVPEEIEIRTGAPSYTGRLCVIGSMLKESALEALFQI